MQATIRYIANGFVLITVSDGPVLQTMYADSIDDLMTMLGTFFTAPVTAIDGAPRDAVPYEASLTDPMMGQEAIVSALTVGGFITKAMSNMKLNTPSVEINCVDMEEVRVALNTIFSYVPPVTP